MSNPLALPVWGRWTLYPALARLQNETAALEVDLRTVQTTKRVTELLMDLSRDPEADAVGLARALDEILDPLCTLVPDNARRLTPGEILSRCLRVAQQAASGSRNARTAEAEGSMAPSRAGSPAPVGVREVT